MFDALVPFLSRSLLPGDSGWSRLVCAAFAPILTFFAVPALLTLMGFLALDFGSGFCKALLLQRVSSARLGDLFNRGIYYVVVFSVLHLMTVSMPQPFNLLVGLFEGFVLSGYLFKEAISVLENLKAIQMARGVADPILDLLIDKLGIDSQRILEDFEATNLLGHVRPREGWRLPGARFIRRPRLDPPEET